MSNPEEKQTKHTLIVRLLSETPTTSNSALFQLAKSIDKEMLQENGLILLGFDFDNAEPGTHTTKEKGTSKIRNIDWRSPLGIMLTYLKGSSARNLYIGFCGFILLAILLSKWIMRLIAGTF